MIHDESLNWLIPHSKLLLPTYMPHDYPLMSKSIVLPTSNLSYSSLITLSSWDHPLSVTLENSLVLGSITAEKYNWRQEVEHCGHEKSFTSNVLINCKKTITYTENFPMLIIDDCFWQCIFTDVLFILLWEGALKEILLTTSPSLSLDAKWNCRILQWINQQNLWLKLW